MPGTAGLEHRIGGLEKGEGHGNISYDPANHDLMVRTRAAKVERIARDIPPLRGRRPVRRRDDAGARLGVDVRPDRRRLPAGPRLPGMPVAQAHLRHLNPFPADLGDVLRGYDAVMVPEMNLGQLSMLLRAKYLVDVVGYNQVRGLPLRAAELADAITERRSTR